MALRVLTVTIPDTMEELTSTQLGLLVMQLAELAKVEKVAKAYLAAQMESGKPVPGWVMAPGKRAKEWLSEADAIKAMGAAGINDPYKRTLLTPTQALEAVTDPDRAAKIDAAWKWVEGKKSPKPGAGAGLIDVKPVSYGF
jgi:hypothetical protein